MRKLFRIFFCGVLLLAGFVFGSGAANAHTLPESELVLLHDLEQEDRTITREFRIGMSFDEVEAALGNEFELEDKHYEFRLVNYKYGGITFGTISGRNDMTPTGKLEVRSIYCRNPWFRTPSGFRVGDPYEKVRKMYGEGKLYKNSEYVYTISPARLMSFIVNPAGHIEEIQMCIPIM